MKELQGTKRADRSLSNEISPAPITMPTPPDWLTDYAKDEWYNQTCELEALKILSTLDLSMLAMYCQQVGIFRQAQEELFKPSAGLGVDFEPGLVVTTPNGALQPNPLLGIANKAADIALKIASQFGFTPSARTRIGTFGKDEPEDELEKLLRQTAEHRLPIKPEQAPIQRR